MIILFFCSFLFSQDISEGFTLFTPAGINSEHTTYLIDIDGSIYNSWRHDLGPASMPYLHPGEEPGFENSLLYYPCRAINPTMSAGGEGGKVEIYNWDGDKLWEFVLSDNIYQHHHDIDVLPNGNILMIAWERKYASDWQAMGRILVENSLNQMWSTAILEIEPNLDTGEANIVWEWHLWDHLVQDIGSSYDAVYGEISDHPELMDVNCGIVGNGDAPGQANADWMHINAIDYNPYLDQIALSARNQNEIYIIDHSTTRFEAASHSGGNSGMGGDFLYRWGSPRNYGRGNSINCILMGQHGVNWVQEDYPGEGNLIIFNNLHSFNSSAVLEIQTPINNFSNYDIYDNEPFGPEEIYWQFENDLFFSSKQSGAFRLPNGNTLITDSNDSYIFEVTAQGEYVWEYFYPYGNSFVARADRYAYDFFDAELQVGDVNGDQFVNVVDVICAVNILLGIDPILSTADVNNDGLVNIVDVVYIVSLIL